MKQVFVAVFLVDRDMLTSKVIKTTHVDSFWVEQRDGVALELLVVKKIGEDYDLEKIVVKEVYSMYF